MVGRLLPFLLDPLGKVYNLWVSMLNFHGILPFEHRELDCIESSRWRKVPKAMRANQVERRYHPFGLIYVELSWMSLGLAMMWDDVG